MVSVQTISKKHRKNKGAILALMLMLVLLISLSSVALIAVARQARIRTVQSVSEVSARFAADAGIERALYVMNQKLQAGTWTVDDVPAYTAEPLTAANANYTVTYTGSLAGGYQITSVGRSGNRTKTVRVTVALTSPFAENYAVLGKGVINLGLNTTVKGYNSADPSDSDIDVKMGTQSTLNNSIQLGDNTTIEGNIFIGPGGDPDTVIKKGSNVDIAGDIFVSPTDIYLPVITPPDLGASRGPITCNNMTLNASDSGKYSGITVNNASKLMIDGDVILYVTGDLTLLQKAAVEIKDGSALTLYLDGDLNAGNMAGLNNKSKIPANFVLYGTGAAQQFNIMNVGTLYGLIYAPNADMSVLNMFDMYGSFFLDSLKMMSGGSIFYDKALKDVTIGDQLARFTITRWEEL